MKFVIALLLAQVSAIRLRNMDAPPPLNVDVAFAGSFSDAPVSAGFVQLAADPAAELAKAPATAADAPAPVVKTVAPPLGKGAVAAGGPTSK